MFPERVLVPPCLTHRVARFGAKSLDTEGITRIDEAMRDSYSLHLIRFPMCNALDFNTLITSSLLRPKPAFPAQDFQ
jgi:hypothetical protein